MTQLLRIFRVDQKEGLNMQTQRATTNELKLRPGRAEDAVELGRICFDAFGAISKAHNFPPDFPSPDVATGLISMILTRSDVYDVVAEENGRTVGSNFLWKGDAVAGVGPITVDTNVQNSSIGRALMTDVLAHADKNGILSVRLVQAAFHNRSLSLYTKLGFDAVEPLSNINGPAVGITIDGYNVPNDINRSGSSRCRLPKSAWSQPAQRSCRSDRTRFGESC